MFVRYSWNDAASNRAVLAACFCSDRVGAPPWLAMDTIHGVPVAVRSLACQRARQAADVAGQRLAGVLPPVGDHRAVPASQPRA